MRLLYIICLFSLLTACTHSNTTDQLIPKAYKPVFDQATIIMDQAPDRAIRITDSILRLDSILVDPVKCKIYQIKQKAYLNKSQSDSTMAFGDSVRFYAEKYNDSITIVKSLLVLPETYIDYSKRKSMNAYFPIALRIFNTPETQKEFARILSLKVIQLENEGEYNVALDLLLKAYDINVKINDKHELARITQMIANVYGDLNNPNLAFKYYKLFENLAYELNDSIFIASANTNYGVYYRRINKDSSIYFYSKALAIHDKRPFSLSKVQTLYNLANLYFDKASYTVAKSIYDSILNICNTHQFQEGILMTYNGISTIYFKEKKYDDAIAYMKKSIYLADSLNMSGTSLRLRPDLISMYYYKGDYKTAADELFKMNHLNDSILSNQKQIALIELEKRYQSEAKDRENLYLHTQLNYRKTIIVILTLMAFIFFVLFRQRNRLYKERDVSYKAIMNKYKAEKDDRERAMSNNEITSNIVSSLSLYDKILIYYKNERPYINSKFRVDDLANDLNTSQKEIAQTLKHHQNLNFSSFTNKYRVETARKMFEDPAFFHIKMEVIAEKSGFGTIQSFYNAFESFTGVKPGYYRTQIATNKS